MELGLRERYDRLRREVAAEAASAGRTADITLVAVTKMQPAQTLRAAVAAGVKDVGESYLQEARGKFAELGDLPVRRHFIGHVQTNKAKGIAQTFDVVQSIDRVEAGRALGHAASLVGKRLRVLVQVNVSATQRFGCAPGDAAALASALREEPALDVDGVMAIGPATRDTDELRRAFARARRAFEDVGGKTLSLGMSDDWREAIRAGSTMIRVGSSLFGPRTRKAEPPRASKT